MSTNSERRQPAARPQQEESTANTIWSLVQRVILVYAATQLIQTFFLGKKPPSGAPPTPQGMPVDSDVDPSTLPPLQAFPAWNTGQNVSMHVYFSTSPIGDVFGVVNRKNWGQAELDTDAGVFPHWTWDNIPFGDWNEARSKEVHVEIPWAIRKNLSALWADVFLTKDGANPNPTSPGFEPNSVHHVRKLLTRYRPRPKIRKEHNLLTSKNETVVEEEDDQPRLIMPYWHPNLTLALISDSPTLNLQQIMPVIHPHIRITGQRDQTGRNTFYLPIIYPNDFWHLREHEVEMNTTYPSDPNEKLILPLTVTFQPMSYMKMQVFASMTHGFEEAAKNGQAAGELDEIKRMLVETNPWFLALTATVSVLHTVFEMLAFKNDVSHWRKKNELIGVSVRTIITNVVVQFIILLYLLDNNADTSWMIVFGQGMGMVIEAWKVTKAVDIRLIQAPPGSVIPYKLDIKDKHVLTEEEKKTQEYDKEAFRYVSYVAIPLLGGYTIYSVLYESHRGWYSFVISTLTSFVYMFGFVQLVPQLIINWRLKSVAHMPMKAMIYKTLSTVVDDFFAFCIRMPWLHRLACFRDDVVFLIFLYQRWIYRVDKKRVNEYGQVAELEPEKPEGVDEKGETKKDK
ncbi:cleft lip and palate transmembrane 1 [Serendipita vermifera]|nr:cleft lip and palate transmembrane 1 [Serendipita vermifera]